MSDDLCFWCDRPLAPMLPLIIRFLLKHELRAYMTHVVNCWCCATASSVQRDCIEGQQLAAKVCAGSRHLSPS